MRRPSLTRRLEQMLTRSSARSSARTSRGARGFRSPARSSASTSRGARGFRSSARSSASTSRGARGFSVQAGQHADQFILNGSLAKKSLPIASEQNKDSALLCRAAAEDGSPASPSPRGACRQARARANGRRRCCSLATCRRTGRTRWARWARWARMGSYTTRARRQTGGGQEDGPKQAADPTAQRTLGETQQREGAARGGRKERGEKRESHG